MRQKLKSKMNYEQWNLKIECVTVTQRTVLKFNRSMYEYIYCSVETSRRLLLYKSALKGDWKRAEFVLNDYPHYVRCAITRNKETVLHVAAGAKQSVFVEELVSRMTRNDMALRDKYGNTALCFAATSRIVKIAKLMVEKNHELPLIRTFREGTPLLIAVSYKSRDMISYLLSVTDLSQLTAQERIELLIATIHSDFHGKSFYSFNNLTCITVFQILKTLFELYIYQ